MIAALLVVSIANGVLGLQPAHWEPLLRNSSDLQCDDAEMQFARQLIKDGMYQEALMNPCLPPYRVQGLIDGTEDPEDNYEFLGRDEEENFVEGADRSRTLMPKIVFLGLPHSGSTSLAEQMNMHPELSYGKMKEHNMLWDIAGPTAQKSRQKYMQTFGGIGSSVKYTFDASPFVFFVGCDDDQVASRYKAGTGTHGINSLRKVLGSDVKFILMLRNPIDWLYSEQGRSKLSSMDRFLSENSVYGKRSCYGDILHNWYQVYSPSHFLHLTSEEYFNNLQGTLDKVFNFVGVSPRKYSEKELEPMGRRRNSRHPSAADRHRFFSSSRQKRCIAKLKQLTHSGYNWS